MLQLILRRVATVIPTALIGSVLLFMLVHFVPGGVAAALAGSNATPEVLAQIEQELGLNRPLAVQYWEWLEHVLGGDFGRSLLDRRPIAEAILDRLPLTVELAGGALLIALIVGMPLGVVAARRRHSAVDSAITGISGLGLAMPEFWLAMLAINLFALHWAMLPATGIAPWSDGAWEHLQSLIMPVLTLASGAAAAVTRFTRSGMIEALSSSYARTALALGLPRRQILFRFALRNALIPVVTIIGLLAGGLLGGAVLVEEVYAIPGLGDMFVIAVQQKDYPAVTGRCACADRVGDRNQPRGRYHLRAARSPHEALTMKALSLRGIGIGLWLAVAFLVMLVMIGIFAPLLAPYDPLKQDLAHSFAGPGWAHPFGTDNLGRDVLSRIMWGARPALLGLSIALASTAIVGLPWGLAAGYLGEYRICY